jgi:hypothetical protein
MKIFFPQSSTVAKCHVFLALALLTGCQTNVNDALATYRTDSHLQDGVLLIATAPAYLLWIRTAKGPEILRTGTPEEIRTSAAATARADIAAGKPRVAFTGSVASMPVGIPPEYFSLANKLPKVPLPSGCMATDLEQATIYAEAYNKEILPYLLTSNETQRNH